MARKKYIIYAIVISFITLTVDDLFQISQSVAYFNKARENAHRNDHGDSGNDGYTYEHRRIQTPPPFEHEADEQVAEELSTERTSKG
jgi:hypothetical protein